MAKTKKQKKRANLFSSLSRSKKIFVIVAIAIIGTFTVQFIFAQTNKPSYNLDLPTERVALSISNEKPTVISRDSSGKITHESRGKSIDITASGTVYCTPEDEGEITTVQLSQQEVDRILSSVKNSAPEVGATDATEVKTSVGNSKQLQLAGSGTTEVLETDKNQSNTNFNKAEQILDAVCGQANQTVPELDVPVIVPEEVKTPHSSSSSRISLVPKAYAGGDPVKEPALSPDVERDQVHMINNERRARGIQVLGRSECLTAAARKWSKNMALVNTLYHSPLRATVENECGSGWWQLIGENVGKSGDSASVFHAYMQSPGHRANILNTRFQRVGVGAYYYKHPSNPWTLLWTTQLFAQCIGSCAEK